MGSRVDLHIHTTASDGTDNPQALLKNLAEAGINTFAVTDHDTIKGAMAVKGLVPSGMSFIQGIEFSCRTEAGEKCHILGLNYDENNADFQEALRTGDDLRHQKFRRRVELLRSQFGITFTHEEIATLLAIPSVGKPHLANMLVSKGWAKTRQEAITKFIDKCRTGTDRIAAGLAVRAILSSGGVPVWAHPLGGEGEPRLPEYRFKAILGELMALGLEGLECWYSKYPAEKCEWLVSQAERKGLLISGGSDYHGTNKSIPLGRLNADDIEIDSEKLTILGRVRT